MELSEAKEKAKQLIDYYFKECDREEELLEYERGHISEDDAIDVIQVLLKALDNSISKDEVRKLYEEHKKILRYYDDCNLEQDDTYHECIKVCDVLLELLGE